MKLEKIISNIQGMTWQEILIYIAKQESVIFSTSFSIEDQIILDQISQNSLDIKVFTLDTGRLLSETYEIWDDSVRKYNIKIQAYYPNNIHIENFVNENGINCIYNSPILRKQCCYIRKVEPLRRALKSKKIWISGIRAEHSESRRKKEVIEFDEELNIIKLYPLMHVKTKDIWNYIKHHNVQYNSLYNKGYESIGCAPCTRAGSLRTGRWWWENNNKECGIHFIKGKSVRINK